MRPCEHLSRKQREETSRYFATYLISLIRKLFQCTKVTALWVRKDSVYKEIKDVDCWDLARDARTYLGPHPIIAHPPCGPYGNYWYKSQESMEHGKIALEFVRKWGGVVEQPIGSSLFDGLEVVKLDQYDYGHPALKPTILYFVGPSQVKEFQEADLISRKELHELNFLENLLWKPK